MEEDFFSAARVESIRGKKYNRKVSKNEIRRNFIEAYLENSDNLKESARIYELLKKGIIPDSTSTDFCVEPITEDLINSIYKEIADGSKDSFLKFFESYKRKIDLGYSEEYVENALSDLKTAYIIYRKCTTPNWNCPDKMISESEMENLYLLFTKNKKVEDTTLQK